MKLSTKVRYGVRAMVELAKPRHRSNVPLRELARNQGISAKYLEQMMSSLKIAGLVESVRGAEGGYRLTRPAGKITVLDVYKVLNVGGEIIDCRQPSCPRLACCAARQVWQDLIEAINHVLASRTLQQLAEIELELAKKAAKA